jgi:integrase
MKTVTSPSRGAGHGIDNTPLSIPSNPPSGKTDLQLIATVGATARDFIRASLSKATQRAYKADLEHFRAWGGVVPSTPVQVAQYLADHAETLAVATLRRRLATLAKAHAFGGYPNPVDSEAVKLTLRGIRRTHGKPQGRARPIECADLLRIVGEPKTNQEVRDQALLLIGFAGAFRRSEIVALDIEDLEFIDQGLLITLRRSKTDQEGSGRQVPIPFARGNICPVRALRRWLESSGIDEGAIFRPITRAGRVLPARLTPQSVALILRKRLTRIGLSVDRMSGHSLRAGFVTSAAKIGTSIAKISAQTGHRSTDMVLRYVREADLFEDHPLPKLL